MQPAGGPRDAPPDASEAAVSSPVSLPREIVHSAALGDLQRVVEWLHKGGAIDALFLLHRPPWEPVRCCSRVPIYNQAAADKVVTASLLHTATKFDQLEMVRDRASLDTASFE